MADKAKRIPAPVLHRTFDIERAALKEDRTLELSFSSEAPVERWFGTETLDHKPSSVDLSRLNSGGPLLVEHNPRDQVGVVESARVDSDHKGRAVVRFGSSARANEIFEDVKAAIRRKVSVGYRVRKMVLEKEEDGVEHYRATSWSPLELSIVAVPADDSVGVGRNDSTEHQDILIENRTMNILREAGAGEGAGGTPPNPAPAQPQPQTRAETLTVEQVLTNERHRTSEIDAIADRVGTPTCREYCKLAKARNTSLEEVRKWVLEHEFQAKPIANPDTAAVGMTDKEVKRYSLVRAMHLIANKMPLDGIEKEASDAVAKNLRRQAQGFFVPTDVVARSFAESKDLSTRDVLSLIAGVNQVRALQSNVFSAAGALVGTDLLTGSLIELLRNQMFVMEMGARSLTGLVGDVAIPRQTGGATAYWLGQGATLTRSDQAVGQLALTPHRLAASTAYDKQLLAQSSLSVEAFVREDLMTVLAIEKDRAAINGSGVSGEPLGILNLTGKSTLVTFSTAAAPLFTELITMETNLATNNADRGSLGYLVHPSVRGHAKGYPKFASTGTPIWENDMMNGYKARSTNQVPSATSVIFGNWSDLIVADWDGMDVVVDPYTLSLQGQISIVLQTLTDLGVRHATSFTNSTN